MFKQIIYGTSKTIPFCYKFHGIKIDKPTFNYVFLKIGLSILRHLFGTNLVLPYRSVCVR